jgi:hydroxypyruvate reductase
VGIVAGTSDPPSQVPGFRYYRGGHPVPTAESLRAAETILRALNAHTSRSLVIYMLSGGGSAAVEKPLVEEITLEDLVATYRELVHSGAPIAEINAIRKHLSAVKGGRMARAAYPAQQVSILVSDVPENALDSLASGPTMPDTSTVDDCYAIAQKHGLLGKFPDSVQQLFKQQALEETPKPDDPIFQHSRWWPVLSNATAQKAAVAQAVTRGFAVDVDTSCDDWDYARAADHLLQRLRELRRGVSRACLISGGEVTVKVAGKSGIGGRNQQFALYCATSIEGENITVLSAGTDGIDGNSPAAGAVVDGTSTPRAQALGLQVSQALAGFDAYPLFEKLEDAIMTGPTGNNVRDLRILLAY